MLERFVAHGCSSAIRALTGARALWRGCEPSAERRVYYGNHASHGDFVMIWSALPPVMRRRVRPVAAADYWNRSALRRFLIHEVFHGVLIERDPVRRTENAIDTLCEAVDGGGSLIIFPEGTRNTGEGLLPFKSGLYRLAQRRPELELVPVWIDNLKRAMPKGRILPLPLLCTATFGCPIRLAEDEGKEPFLERARSALLELSENGVNAHRTGGPA